MKSKSGQMVQSSIGENQLDNTGAAIGAARINPDRAYNAIGMLLKEYINDSSESAWKEIQTRTDNIYDAVSSAIEALDGEVSFSRDILKHLEAGKKLLFKPNMVSLPAIDPRTHEPRLLGVCTPWEFVAAVMRWFHDKKSISYHQMSMGEAGPRTSLAAALMSRVFGGKTVTTQAVMEGKCGENYGGWGFYFTRKYLAACHDPSHKDDPMSGYEESVSGVCLPPGKVHDRLLVYDLNKIANDFSNGRDVPVADGVNFKTITLHKAIVGGDPNDPQDISDWPGCVLINVCKLKIHGMELFTCATKNMGIGFYPTEVNTSREPGKYRWKYAVPNLEIPVLKTALPHKKWLIESDKETGDPVRDKDGNYIWKKTGGLEATIADSVQAVRGQGIMMLHVVDAIETTNINHVGMGGVLVPEGFVFASTDPVAMDVCTSRYLFNMVPMAETDKICKDYNLTSDVIQKVPMPKLEGVNIVTSEGYDSSFSRYGTLKHCADRGLGQQSFYVIGKDLWQGGSLASLNQHLGRVDNGVFSELLTSTHYHTPPKPLWDYQATCLAYLELNDKLTGSDFKRKILEEFDENGDGIIDYMETGREGSPAMMFYLMSLAIQDVSPLEAMRLRFLISTVPLKRLKKEWNPDNHNLGEHLMMVQALAKAFAMSRANKETPDPLFQGRTWGNGKWPSLQYAMQQQMLTWIYGQMFPNRFDSTMSPYGCSFSYADTKWNGAKYCGAQAMAQNEDIIGNYHKAVEQGGELLPFILYVPKGFGSIGNTPLPNVSETDDPELIFTASFNGEEVWRDLQLSSFHLK